MAKVYLYQCSYNLLQHFYFFYHMALVFRNIDFTEYIFAGVGIKVLYQSIQNSQAVKVFFAVILVVVNCLFESL